MDLPPEELRRLVAKGEGKALEFKCGLPRDEKVARTLCAFANTRGGLLLVGVDDRGVFRGAPRARETRSRLRAVAAGWLDPPLSVETGSVEVDGARVVWCSVPLSPARPHAAIDLEGRRLVLVRAGSSNRAASGATLAAIRVPAASRGLDLLQRQVLAWVVARSRAARAPGGDATVAGFARAHNVGLQRARRAFTHLELAGKLVGHGAGARRVFGPA